MRAGAFIISAMTKLGPSFGAGTLPRFIPVALHSFYSGIHGSSATCMGSLTPGSNSNLITSNLMTLLQLQGMMLTVVKEIKETFDADQLDLKKSFLLE